MIAAAASRASPWHCQADSSWDSDSDIGSLQSDYRSAITVTTARIVKAIIRVIFSESSESTRQCQCQCQCQCQ